MENYIFPFGNKVEKVYQKNPSTKKVFVLGVYASAVHAKWISKEGKQITPAIVVSSEPCIFWDGNINEAKEIISQIKIPSEIGTLVPSHLNGPSGITLDELYLKPLNLTRDDVWLCDLLPYARLNKGQLESIEKNYLPLINKYNLPNVTLPIVPKIFCNLIRFDEIVQEIELSKATEIILLGDIPLKEFYSKITGQSVTLSEITDNKKTYGKPVEVTINQKHYNIIPLAHPRQTGKLGISSPEWANIHSNWIKNLNH